MDRAPDTLPSAGSRGPRPSVPLRRWGEHFFKKESRHDFEVYMRDGIRGGGGGPQLGVDALRF